LVFVIAEIGTNHVGSVDIAKKIIDISVRCGCNAVKFQKKNIEKIYTKEFLDSPLDSPWGKTQRDMRVNREFTDKQFKEIDRYCKKNNITWFVSCWDIKSQIHMRKFKTKFNKVASAMLVHENLLHTIAKEGKYTFISTGMSTMQEISKAVKIFKKHDCPFELMHSNSSYPMELEEANLLLIPKLRKKFHCNIGYSGHEKASYISCVIATTLGATSIERHVTVDRTLYGHDQAASLEESGLRRMVRDIRLVETILGDGEKRIWDSERDAIKKLRQIFI